MHVLLESGPRRTERGGGWTLASVLMHATLIGSALALTARGIAVRPGEARLPGIQYVVPSPPQRQLEQQRESNNPHAPTVPAKGPTIPIPLVAPFDPAPGVPIGPLTGIEELGPARHETRHVGGIANKRHLLQSHRRQDRGSPKRQSATGVSEEPALGRFGR